MFAVFLGYILYDADADSRNKQNECLVADLSSLMQSRNSISLAAQITPREERTR